MRVADTDSQSMPTSQSKRVALLCMVMHNCYLVGSETGCLLSSDWSHGGHRNQQDNGDMNPAKKPRFSPHHGPMKSQTNKANYVHIISMFSCCSGCLLSDSRTLVTFRW